MSERIDKMRRIQEKIYEKIGIEDGWYDVEKMKAENEINIGELKALNDIYIADIRIELKSLHEKLTKQQKRLIELIDDNSRLDLIAEVFIQLAEKWKR